MARQSSASLSIVPVSSLQRLAPPADLTAPESELWAAVVESKPADWFQADSAPLLKEYVRAVVMSDRLSLLVEAALAGDAGEDGLGLKDALRLRDMESKRVASLGTKLRLTQQSRYTPKASATADRAAGGARPWQQAAQK